MASADDDVTIVLTLKDRGAFTRRWMSYANAVKLPFAVLIADGGADEEVTGLLAAGGNFPNVRYRYIRYPYDDSYARYYAKIADALSQVTTPFVAMADNDDLFVIDGVRAAAEFLRTHPDHLSCGGQSASFWVRSEEGKAGDGVYGSRVDWKQATAMSSITGETARERIRVTTPSAADASYYYVKRTADLRRHFEIVRALNLHDLFLTEHLLWFLNAIAGKTWRIPDLYIARQQNSPDSSGETHAGRYGDWFGRMLVPSWSGDFASFMNATAAALVEADRIPEAEAREAMIAAYRLEVTPALLRTLVSEPSVTAMMPVVAHAVERLVALPRTSLVRRFARRLYRSAGWLSSDVIYGMEIIARRLPREQRARGTIAEFLARGESD
jgi:glycosyltransferase domain-containing protein